MCCISKVVSIKNGHQNSLKSHKSHLSLLGVNSVPVIRVTNKWTELQSSDSQFLISNVDYEKNSLGVIPIHCYDCTVYSAYLIVMSVILRRISSAIKYGDDVQKLSRSTQKVTIFIKSYSVTCRPTVIYIQIIEITVHT